MKEFDDEYCTELEKMAVSSAQFEAKERMADADDDDNDDNLHEYGPEEENTVELEQHNLPSKTGEGNIIMTEVLHFVLESKLKFFYRK